MICTRIPDWLRVLIASPPHHGAGVHQWLFKVARHLHAHLDFEAIVSLLKAAVGDCGRHVPENEIRDAVENSKSCEWSPSGLLRQGTWPSAKKWPEINKGARQWAMDGAGIQGMADLWDASPVPCSIDPTDADFFVDRLFPGNPLLCAGHSNSEFLTAQREDFRGELSRLSLVVPSPMSAFKGRRKKDGKESAHTLENTGPRHFLVCEFDTGTEDEQAKLLWHLRQFAPLALVVSSGGKSLHGWFNSQGVAEDTVYRFMRYAVNLGADPATWTRSQFVRLPQGWRADKEARQEVAYFNPNLLEGEGGE